MSLSFSRGSKLQYVCSTHPPSIWSNLLQLFVTALCAREFFLHIITKDMDFQVLNLIFSKKKEKLIARAICVLVLLFSQTIILMSDSVFLGLKKI